MKFTLPLPPSINRTYIVRRYSRNPLVKRYYVLDWEREAGMEIIRQVVEVKRVKPSVCMFTGYVQVGITWYYKIDRDIDAGIKILFDLLEKQRIVLNDRQIRKVTHIDIFQDVEHPRVEIEIEELKA